MTPTTPRPVFLHVGAMKTGTTFLQGLMFANRDALLDHGVLLPGKDFEDQARAVREVLRLTHDDEHLQGQAAGSWQDLTDELGRRGHRASVISMEFLSFAGRRKVRRVVRSLGDHDVHVVMTVRDTSRLLPALWQTMVHSGSVLSWQELLDTVTAWQPDALGLTDLAPTPGRAARSELRRTAGVSRMMRRWAAVVPQGHLHVVTVPLRNDDPTLLWRRFAEVLGIDPAVASAPPPDANASIGYASTELVRRVNLVLPPLSRSEYLRTVKAQLALTILAGRRGLEGRAQLTAPAYDAALRANATVHAAVREVGADLVGDPGDLPVEPDRALRASLPDTSLPPPETEVLDAAALAVVGLQELRDRRVRRLRRRGGRPEPIAHPEPEGALARWREAADPVEVAAREVAARCHELGMLLREWRRRRSADSPASAPE